MSDAKGTDTLRIEERASTHRFGILKFSELLHMLNEIRVEKQAGSVLQHCKEMHGGARLHNWSVLVGFMCKHPPSV